MAIDYGDTLLNTAEAAKSLGMTASRVRKLVETGVLTGFKNGGTLLVTAKSVRRCQQRERKSGRPFSPKMAFAALYMISGKDVTWLTSKERYRLKTRLRKIDVESLLSACSRRAETREYWCLESRFDTVSDFIRISSATGSLADKFELVRVNDLEGYISRKSLEELSSKVRLREGVSQTNIRLRVTTDAIPGEGDSMPLAVCAADLSESGQVREHYAGMEKLNDLLEEYKRKDSRS
ncbi:helix-turn-helix domain-containing protein [Bifidobacterium callitrichidarum]|nr:helix-turn-helix domain-containing protein [Bifidobacterium callitrichidarum]